ncbi:hypothetical protein [Bartonella apihabitans]|uniref:hypothetical protein n=1 Tax=Bartonella apihabitans TaxID=2750929 RepID=UPI0009901EBF|nr:hypothetical protein [Bartonella apihabitans]
MRQRALCRKEWERTVFLRKNADGILLMGKLESKLFTREITRCPVNQQAQFEGARYFCITGLPMKGLFIPVKFQ